MNRFLAWWHWAFSARPNTNFQGTSSGVLHWIMEAPFPAHLLGSVVGCLLMGLAVWLLPAELVVLVGVMYGAASWQLSKVDAMGWDKYGLSQVVPRLWIGLVGALLLVGAWVVFG